MVDVDKLKRAEILAISLDNPEILFGKPEFIDDIYKFLAKKWHPDHSGDEDVIKHINLLRASAKKITLWKIPGELTFRVDDKTYSLKYFKSYDFELGKLYISENRVTYVLRKEFNDLAENAKTIISGFKFPNEKIKEVIGQYLPKILEYYVTDDSIVVMISKSSNLIRLSDLKNYLGGKIEPRHVAWIINRIYDQVCFFSLTKLSHNDISIDNIYVSPSEHTLCLLGGWWYAKSFGDKLIALPQRTIDNVPSELLKNKVSISKTDLELTRLTAREALGNANGIHLMTNKNIPEKIIRWLRLSSNGNAIKDFREWGDVLKDCYGPRKFITMDVSASDVYSKI